jgi:hypothetical protein
MARAPHRAHLANVHNQSTHMRGGLLRLAAVSAILTAACTYAGTPVPLRGRATDIAALAGRWDGEFWSEESRRNGSLLFTIRAGTDTAFGDVVLTPTSFEPVIAADAKDPVHLQHSRAPEVLRIHFVTVRERVIQGEIEPYVAPDCKCVVVTEFLGTVEGDAIDGTYTTRGPGIRQEGRWSMRRTGASP